MRTRILVVAILAVGALACTALLSAGPGESPVNRASFRRLRLGMTEAEVEQVFGGPAGDYRRGSKNRTHDVGIAPLPGQVAKRWRGDEGLVLVMFQKDKGVVSCTFIEPPDLPHFERVLAILGL